MRVLLDTCVLIWWFSDPERLSGPVDSVCRDSSVELFVSAAVPWEMSIKSSAKRLRLPETTTALTARIFYELGAQKLPIDFQDAIRAGELPLHHKDPFDRIMIAQALERDLTVATPDPLFRPYGVRLLW